MGRASRTACALPGDHPRPRPTRPPPAGRRGRPRPPHGRQKPSMAGAVEARITSSATARSGPFDTTKGPFFSLSLLELREQDGLGPAHDRRLSGSARCLWRAARHPRFSRRRGRTGGRHGWTGRGRRRHGLREQRWGCARRKWRGRNGWRARGRGFGKRLGWRGRCRRELRGCEWKRGDGGVRRCPPEFYAECACAESTTLEACEQLAYGGSGEHDAEPSWRAFAEGFHDLARVLDGGGDE